MNEKRGYHGEVHVIHYQPPAKWICYDPGAVLEQLVDARASLMTLLSTPYQRDWVDALQKLQLKMEVGGTSQIEGADFSGDELDVAIDPAHKAEDLLTRSQRQAAAAADTYRWLRNVPTDLPLTDNLICAIHRRLVTGCDEDTCEPGAIRRTDQNVTFGTPRHRGAEGGPECESAFASLVEATRSQFRGHDPLIQALALHYHFAAMHPFLDGNGRTARALEAFMLQKAGLRDTAFIAMSNYYYDEKAAYLRILAEVRTRNFDLTSFLIFGLRGIAAQCKRLLVEIKKNMERILFKATAAGLFSRLSSERKRLIGERQVHLLNRLLEVDRLEWSELVKNTVSLYSGVKQPRLAIRRDIMGLLALNAISFTEGADKRPYLSIRLSWPSEITESEFFERAQTLPKAKTHQFLT